MKFLAILPRSEKLSNKEKQFLEFDVKKIAGLDSFIEQRIGKEPVKRVVGDYLFWISNPQTMVETEEDFLEVEDSFVTLTPNLLLNEAEVCFGEVIVTSHIKTSVDEYEGLQDVDIAYIENAFTLTETVLVEDIVTGEYVAVDKLFDGLLSPNGATEELQEDIEPDIIVEDDSIIEPISESQLPDIDEEVIYQEIED